METQTRENKALTPILIFKHRKSDVSLLVGVNFKAIINFIDRGNFIAIGEVNVRGELYKTLNSLMNLAIHVRTRRSIEDIVAGICDVLANRAVLCFSEHVCVIYISKNLPLMSKQRNLHM